MLKLIKYMIRKGIIEDFYNICQNYFDNEITRGTYINRTV